MMRRRWGFDEMQRPHIVQPIGQLLLTSSTRISSTASKTSVGFSPRSSRLRLDLTQFGHAVDQPRNLLTKARFDIFTPRRSACLPPYHGAER
jgi:hypothetical protein